MWGPHDRRSTSWSEVAQNSVTRPQHHLCAVLALCTAAVGFIGCSRIHPPLLHEYVYVVAKQTFLRDRVAAVSNRTGTVDNGQRLQVLEHGRRFLHVQTEKGEQGWIDEKATASQAIYDEFEALKSQHTHDAPVASAVVRDDVYLHALPGRDTDRLFRLAEGDKLVLIRRATLPKAGGPQVKLVATLGRSAKSGATSPKPAIPPSPAIADPSKPVATPAMPDADTGPPMEDWWLIRDADGRTGWLLSRMMDVDAPDALTRYAEGQRIVGAYILGKVNDPEIEGDSKDVPEYVTVLSPYKSGLPYDFDQVRVFIWNVKKHRYETAFREHNIAGYLPVRTSMAADPYGKQPVSAMPAPTFRLQVLPADAPTVIPDPTTGAVAPSRTIEKTYRLEGNVVRRVLPPGAQPPAEAHPNPEQEKPGKHRRHR